MVAITKIFPKPDDLFHAAAMDFSKRAIRATHDKGIFRVVLIKKDKQNAEPQSKNS